MIVSIGIFDLFGKIVAPSRLIRLLPTLRLSGGILAIRTLLGRKFALGVKLKHQLGVRLLFTKSTLLAYELLG